MHGKDQPVQVFKIIMLGSKKEIKSYRFRSTWGWVNKDNILKFLRTRNTNPGTDRNSLVISHYIGSKCHFPLFLLFFPLSVFRIGLFFCLANRCLNLAPISQKALTGAFANLYHKGIKVRSKNRQREGMGFPERPQGEEKKNQKRWV